MCSVLIWYHESVLSCIADAPEMRTILLSSLLLSVVLASALPTLDSEKDLKKTGFGLGQSHHGLTLLKWYVKTCLDKNEKSLCNPVAGAYGFHCYENRDKLLPGLNGKKNTTAYFTLGNLRSPHAEQLPCYVRKDYNCTQPQSNQDRVLVEYTKVNKKISNIFISEHYNKKKTYRIGLKLLAFLKKLVSRFYIKI